MGMGGRGDSSSRRGRRHPKGMEDGIVVSIHRLGRTAALIATPLRCVKSSSPSSSPPPYVSFAKSAMQVPFLPSRETKSADGGVHQLVEALSRL
jgi:hypothetical protein